MADCDQTRDQTRGQTLWDTAVHGKHGLAAVDVDVDKLEPELRRELERLRCAMGLSPAIERREFGRYRLHSVLGKGGMGIVYAGEDPELEREVAIKLVRPKREGSRARLQARLLREGRALARVEHPNVVGVYDVGVESDELFVIMELVKGPTLFEWQSQPERSLDELLDVYLAAAAGLEAVHRVGLVHRDFKPENVFVTPEGRVLVGDFGLAGLDESTATVDSGELESFSGMTEAGAVFGTLGYMAPEQLRGEPIDARCDQFGFCVALWEAISGERPFGHTTDPQRQLEAITAGELSHEDELPRWLRPLLRRGLAADPNARFADLGELIRALEAGRVRRPWQSVGTVVGALAIVGGLVTFGVIDQTNEPCVERQRVDQIWADGRSKLAARLAKAAPDDPAGLDDRTAASLDGRAVAGVERLRTAADSLCAAPDAGRRRTLARAIAELEVTLTGLDTIALEGLVASIESLESFDLERPPIDPAVAEVIDRSRRHEWSGEFDAAWTAAMEAVELARAAAPRGWSASRSEALVQRGRLATHRLEHELALADLNAAIAHARGASYSKLELHAEIERVAMFIRSHGDVARADDALVLLEPTLIRHSRPLGRERAVVHELRSELAALRGEFAGTLAHALAAMFIHTVIRPDGVAAARVHANFGVALERLGRTGAAAYYDRSTGLLDGELPPGHQTWLTVAYNQARLDLESDDEQRRASGRVVLDGLRHEGDRLHRSLATQALLYAALADDDLDAIRALITELAVEAPDAPPVLMGAARLGGLDIDAFDRVRSLYLERGAVQSLGDLEYELAVGLRLAACDLATAGAARLADVEHADRESLGDFERLLASLDCQ